MIRFLVALALAGCSPTYAPPIRGLHHGAPGRLDGRRVEIGGTAGSGPTIGGPHVAVAIDDGAAIEAGANLRLLDDRRWALAWLGPRFTSQRKGKDHRLAGDLELGLGAGVGGELLGNEVGCDGCDGRASHERFAGGAYLGVGGGIHWRWFALFARARVEASGASGIPVTLWPSLMGGAEFDLLRRVTLGAGVGYYWYWNGVDSGRGLFWQLAATVLLGRSP